MKNKEPKDKFKQIVRGLEIAYERMIEFKKYKKTPLVVERDGKVVEIDPFEAEPTTTYHYK